MDHPAISKVNRIGALARATAANVVAGKTPERAALRICAAWIRAAQKMAAIREGRGGMFALLPGEESVDAPYYPAHQTAGARPIWALARLVGEAPYSGAQAL